jgi:hypothetical protein
MILGFAAAITMRFILVFIITETNLSVQIRVDMIRAILLLQSVNFQHERIILSSLQNQGIRLFFYKNRLRLSHLHSQVIFLLLRLCLMQY